MTRWVVVWGPAAAWAAFLFLLSSRSTLPVDLESGLDKVAHFGAYLVLGFLLARGAYGIGVPILVAIAVGWCYGALDEFHQATVPGRMPSVGDWVADALGTAAGVGLFLLILRARGRPGATPGVNGAEPIRQ